MIVVRRVDELRAVIRAARVRGERIAFVPTMGALHDGHLALMQRARKDGECVVVSLFVNPAQFTEAVDLDGYPRDEARDVRLLESVGVHVLFAPAVDEVYPGGFATTVEVAELSVPLEGVARGPQHFRGVATVVTKLLNMVQPDAAFFGQKDAQQALIIQRLVRDLDLPVRIEICPTVREADGLAMSSRNALLDSAARQKAVTLWKALSAVEHAVARGETHTAIALAAGSILLKAEGIEPEYFAAVDAATLLPVTSFTGTTLIAIAARVGGVRLIDNVLIHREGAA
ncbi:MAG: pantoate--beta-alanine ligase [Polaromonas sp.]|nr:pantoate--beta-alanine ligase [Gemmatimonadaceae bacterium]